MRLGKVTSIFSSIHFKIREYVQLWDFREHHKEQTTIGMKKKSIYREDTSQIGSRPCSDGEDSLFLVCAWQPVSWLCVWRR